ncbi:MAG: hypothetical protein WA705_28715 [Candidatus Ozemobacteraceae bacterium]
MKKLVGTLLLVLFGFGQIFPTSGDGAFAQSNTGNSAASGQNNGGKIAFSRSNSGLIDNFIGRMTLFRGAPAIGTENGLSIFSGERFENWRRGDAGFPDAPVRGMAVFGERLWVGTYGKGLGRLDDGTWKRFTSSDSGLADDFVTAVVSTGNRLFVGTREGLSVFDGLLWKNIRLDPDRVLNVTCLALDRQAVLVGTTLGAYRLDENLQPIVLDLGLGFPPWIHALDAAGGTIYVAYDGGILALTADGRRLNWNENQFPSGKVFDLIGFEGGALIATGRGAAKLNFDGGVSILDLAGFKALAGMPSTALLRGGGEWWIGYSGGGLLRLSDLSGFIAWSAGGTGVAGNQTQTSATGFVQVPSRSMEGDNTRSKNDSAKVSNVPTISNFSNNSGASTVSGVSTVSDVSTISGGPSPTGQRDFPPSRQRDLASPQGDFVRPASESQLPINAAAPFTLPGRIRAVLEVGDLFWASTLDGLYRLRSGEAPKRFGPAMPCQALARGSGNSVWTVFETGECYRINGETATPVNIQGLPPSPLSIAVLDNWLIIGSDLGLFVGTMSNGKMEPISTLKNRRVSAIALEQSIVWLGCEDGLYKYQPGNIIAERVSDISEAITSVQVIDGNLWTGDRNGGVMQFVQGRMTDRREGVISGRVSAIIRGDGTDLIVAGENGLSFMNPGNAEIRRTTGTANGGQTLFRRGNRPWIARGSRGEPVDDTVTRAAEPVSSEITGQTGVNRNLDSAVVSRPGFSETNQRNPNIPPIENNARIVSGSQFPTVSNSPSQSSANPSVSSQGGTSPASQPSLSRISSANFGFNASSKASSNSSSSLSSNASSNIPSPVSSNTFSNSPSSANAGSSLTSSGGSTPSTTINANSGAGSRAQAGDGTVSSSGGFRISQVQVFPAPETEGKVSPPSDAGPIPMPPTGSSLEQRNGTVGIETNAGNDSRLPSWTKLQRPAKPKNLGFYKDIIPMMVKSCMSCHTSGTGKYFPLHDPASVISYFRKGGLDRFLQFLEPGNGMYGSVRPEDVQILKIWVGEGAKE